MSGQEQQMKLDGGAYVSAAWLGGVSDSLEDGHPLWLVNEQIKGLLDGFGASEDHEDVLRFLRATGLPDGTVLRMHKAIVFGDSKSDEI